MLFLPKHSPTNSCVFPWTYVVFVQTAREITRTSQSQREIIFDLPHPPTHGPERLDLSRGLPGGDRNRSNWTMHNHLISKQQEWNNCLIKNAHKIHEPFYPGYQMFLLLLFLLLFIIFESLWYAGYKTS